MALLCGHLEPVCFSPMMQGYLGLAFLKDGRARHGATVRLVDHLRGIDVLCSVCHPVFHDAEGGKMRA